jgi:predicted transcriptional regulator
MSQMVDLEGERFLLVARALEKAPRRQAQPATRFAVMLGVEAGYAGDVVYGDPFISGRDSVVTFAGYECMSCSRTGCAQRAHGACGGPVR